MCRGSERESGLVVVDREDMEGAMVGVDGIMDLPVDQTTTLNSPGSLLVLVKVSAISPYWTEGQEVDRDCVYD